jgi:cytochrome P450
MLTVPDRYELYYDVMLGGQYIWAIRDMHEKYGPIVRINPEQIHIQDAEYYNEVFTGPGRKRDKEKSFNPNLNQSIITTTDHDLHRLRRRALAPYFTRAKIRELQPRIDVCIKNLLRRLDSCRELKAPLSASIAYTVFTNGDSASQSIPL